MDANQPGPDGPDLPDLSVVPAAPAGAETVAPAGPAAAPALPALHVIVDPADGTALLRVRDAARYMGCGPRTIYQWIADGKVAVRRTASGQLLVEVGSLVQSAGPATGERVD